MFWYWATSYRNVSIQRCLLDVAIVVYISLTVNGDAMWLLTLNRPHVAHWMMVISTECGVANCNWKEYFGNNPDIQLSLWISVFFFFFFSFFFYQQLISPYLFSLLPVSCLYFQIVTHHYCFLKNSTLLHFSEWHLSFGILLSVALWVCHDLKL